MYGAILGDIIGSPFEFDRGKKTKEFRLFERGCDFTDDTCMSIAVGEALMNAGKEASVDEIRKAVIDSMRKWAKKYPDAGYGGMFYRWLFYSGNPQPYNSFGNGSAMRVSAAGWLYDSLERTVEVARATSEVTHNHREGIKGAESTAAVIFLAREGESKEEILSYITERYGYDLTPSLEEMRQYNSHNETCQRTMPLVFKSFMESVDFEDAIRNAVSMGGDTDTIAAITGSIAEAYYGIPTSMIEEARKRIPSDMVKVMDRFDQRCSIICRS